MPIHCAVKFRSISEAEFKRLDYLVISHAFACQNELGHHCEEAIYQADLALRLRKLKCGAILTEVPIKVSWGDFIKNYYLDLVVAGGAIYELKAQAALAGENKAQLLNYLLLLGQAHGKLINLKPASVEWEFVSTTLTQTDRRQMTFRDRDWHTLTSGCHRLWQILQDLIADWGGFLEISLYEEALISLLGGEAQVRQRIPISRDGNLLGTQAFLLHSPGVAFRITAMTKHRAHYGNSLKRLLAMTPLEGVQWINLNHHAVELTTLLRK
jgi:GxxExxY protein